MRKKRLLGLLLLFVVTLSWAQGDYLVKTGVQKTATGTDEQIFVETNFPFYSMCNWQPGMKFMFVTEGKYSFIAVFANYETGRDVDNAKLQYRIFEFTGVEETEKETHVGKSYFTRFVFESEGEKFYHEIKNKRLNEICAENQRACINNLVYLGDVDKAKELLEGITMYTQVTAVRVDDASGRGYRDVTILPNQEVTIVGVGVGNREFPVKIVFEDQNGSSYYKEVAFSTTNSGLISSDFTGARLASYFSNAFLFEDKSMKTIEEVKKKYVGSPAYPKKTMEATKNGELVTLARYTPLTITNLLLLEGTRATLSLKSREGVVYEVNVDMKYDVFIKNDNYIDDLFGFANLRVQYPAITEENWGLISAGEVKVGMTKDECKLSLGSAVQVVASTISNSSTWYYHGKVLDFDGNTLVRIK